MLSRMKHLPLPPVFGCALINHPPSTLAKRFLETKVPSHIIRAILSNGGGEALLGGEWVLISNDKVAAVLRPETPFSAAYVGMEGSSAVSK